MKKIITTINVLITYSHFLSFQCSSLPLEDAKIIALTTAFLLIQPLGCTAQAICTYIQSITNCTELQVNHLNSVLLKYSDVFKTESSLNESPPSATLNVSPHTVKWHFCGLKATALWTPDQPIKMNELGGEVDPFLWNQLNFNTIMNMRPLLRIINNKIWISIKNFLYQINNLRTILAN